MTEKELINITSGLDPIWHCREQKREYNMRPYWLAVRRFNKSKLAECRMISLKELNSIGINR